MDRSFWQDKKVLVTGHTGFKGTWLCHLLTGLGARVYGLALPPETKPSMFELTATESLVDHHIADICSPEAVDNRCREVDPDIVFHFAAQPLVRRSYAEPRSTTMTNVMGTVHICEALRHPKSVAAAVLITTDKVYHNNEWAWPYREIDPLGGLDPYSASKACSDLMAHAYSQSFLKSGDHGFPKISLTTARAGNVIGGGDWSQDRLIPDIIRAIHQGERLEIRNPDAVRPWQHVLEPLVGYLTLAEHQARDAIEPGAFNFGPSTTDCVPVDHIVTHGREYFGDALKVHYHKPAGAPHEAGLLKLDCSKAASVLQWRPKWDLGVALSHTFDWYQGFLSGDDLLDLTRRQIEAYLAD